MITLGNPIRSGLGSRGYRREIDLLGVRSILAPLPNIWKCSTPHFFKLVDCLISNAKSEMAHDLGIKVKKMRIEN
jgi:hypothetical protein